MLIWLKNQRIGSISNLSAKVSAELTAAPSASDLDSLLSSVTAGAYNARANFWPWVVRPTDGVLLASGRSEEVGAGAARLELNPMLEN